MLQWSERDAVMSSSPSSASSPSLYSHHNHHNHHHLHHSDPYLKPYEEVPAEPIPAPPHLSSIAGSSLAIPRTVSLYLCYLPRLLIYGLYSLTRFAYITYSTWPSRYLRQHYAYARLQTARTDSHPVRFPAQ